MTGNNPSRRAMSFDKVATSYRAMHIGYPDALADAVLAFAGIPKGGRILEVGCGTGAATMRFAAQGFPMVCLEPGANLAREARETLAAYPNVSIRGETFERWPLERGAFDLVFSARALHWVDPSVRFAKAADALRPGGSMAIFKNLEVPGDSPVDLDLRRWIERYQPYPRDRRINAMEQQFAASPHFKAPLERIFSWSLERDAHAYVVSESIRLAYYDLSEAQRSELFSGMERIINEHGGRIRVMYETHLLMARRRDGGFLWRRLTASARRPTVIEGMFGRVQGNR